MATNYPNFIGREAELKSFRQLLEHPYGDVRIALVLGDGGIGKTRLVKKMLEEAHNKKLLVADDPIDLFATDYRHIDGIQWKIKEIIERLPELKGNPSPFKDFVKGKTDTSEKFYECLKAFCAEHPLVLAFDTFENLDKVASDWLFKSGEDGLQVPGLICIVASREKEKPDLSIYRNNPMVLEMYLSGFTTGTADKFSQIIIGKSSDLDSILQEAGVNAGDSARNLEWVTNVTRGHPLKLEMVFNWWGILLEGKSLANLTADKFEELLMKKVQDLADQGLLDIGGSLKVSQPVFDTLICMAHVTRRFDEGFLRYLIEKKLICMDDPNVSQKDILEYLEKYFFVKVRLGNKGEQVLQLHDEMARLVREYVWPFLDSSVQKKEDLLTVIDEYYDQLIADHTGEEADVQWIEKLYYALQRDWQGEGIRLWFQLAELESENMDKLLPGEIKGYIENYDAASQYEINRRIAEMEIEAHHFSQAIGYWEKVKKLGEAAKRTDWIVDALVGKFNASWQVNPEKALNDYLLSARGLAENDAQEKIARVYYEIGFAYRQMQDMEEATDWYEKAIHEFQERPQDKLLEATIRNDAGYAYSQIGQWGNTTKYLNAALDIRELGLLEAKKQLKNGKPEQQDALKRQLSKATIHVGQSHNTLGEFHRHAEDLDEALTHYDAAHKAFQGESHYYWQAKSLGGRGETYRRLALQAKSWGNEKEYKKYVKKAQADMQKCLYLCEKYQLDDERDTAYRRLGRFSHDFALDALQQDKKAKARKYLDESYDYFRLGLKFAEETREVLEELENLTELAFLYNDAIVAFGVKKVPNRYRNALTELESKLKEHAGDKPRIHQYPVFEALLKLEKGAIEFEHSEHAKALDHYLAGYKELATLPGYGVARYKQHFGHLIEQITKLPKERRVLWCKKFIAVWRETPSGRPGKTLADDLIPDLVAECNRLITGIGNQN